MHMEDDFRKFEAICINALTRREHSRAELAAKAHESLSTEVVQAVLDRLAETAYQSDERFAHSYVRAKSTNGDGGLKIRQALKQKGIADKLIREAMDEIDWYTIATTVYCKKYRTPANTPSERAKRQRFMAQRGFSFDEIKAAEAAFKQHIDTL